MCVYDLLSFIHHFLVSPYPKKKSLELSSLTMQTMQCCGNNNVLAPTRPHQYRNAISVLLVDYDRLCYCGRRHQCLLSLIETLKLYSYKGWLPSLLSFALSIYVFLFISILEALFNVWWETRFCFLQLPLKSLYILKIN